MAIPVARVHLAMAHAALPGLLPTPPTCTMLPLLPAPPCAILLPNSSSPPRPSRADAAGRWDAHKTRPAGSPASSSSSSSGGQQHPLHMNKKIVTSSRTSSDKNSRADSEERWDAHKRPAMSTASSSASATSTASSSKTRTCHTSRRTNGARASSSSSSARWDAHKKPRAPPADELDDGESSTASNDVELDMPRPSLPPPPPRSFYAGPGFLKSPEPCMLPMPSFCMIRVA